MGKWTMIKVERKRVRMDDKSLTRRIADGIADLMRSKAEKDDTRALAAEMAAVVNSHLSRGELREKQALRQMRDVIYSTAIN